MVGFFILYYFNSFEMGNFLELLNGLFLSLPVLSFLHAWIQKNLCYNFVRKKKKIKTVWSQDV